MQIKAIRRCRYTPIGMKPQKAVPPQMLVRTCRAWTAHTLLVGMENGRATLESSP